MRTYAHLMTWSASVRADGSTYLVHVRLVLAIVQVRLILNWSVTYDWECIDAADQVVDEVMGNAIL
jgi:hypothetical protein